MLYTGVVSVTFRPLAPARITTLTAEVGLDAVEWGGDIHVPPHNAENACAVARLTADAGLRTASYGSYFRAGYQPQEEFAQVLRTAAVLGAPNIRIWAGDRGHEEEPDRARVVASVRAFAEACEAEGITLSPEFHGGTLTDHYKSAVRLAEEVGCGAMRLYWQPNQFRDDEYNLAALRAVLPYLSNVHVFFWKETDRFPLAQGEYIWRQYIDVIRSADGDHGMFLEFVCDGSEEQFARDAQTLRDWLEKG